MDWHNGTGPLAAIFFFFLMDYSKIRSVREFEKKEQVGAGTYGEVYIAKDKRSSHNVALKRIKMTKEKEGFPITAIREIKILRALNNKNIVSLVDVVTSGEKRDGSVYMVFEAMTQDLTGLMDSDFSKNFSRGQIKSYMYQIFEGLYYCHKNGILHRDIKPSNILLNERGEVKLADFGLSRPYSESRKNYTNRVVTLWYRAPELLMGTTEYGPAIDVWAVGCIMGELLRNKPILPGKNEAEQVKRIWKLCGTPTKSNWPSFSSHPLAKFYKPEREIPRRLKEHLTNLKEERRTFFGEYSVDLLDRLLTLDPQKRISASDALAHDYFFQPPKRVDLKKLPKYPPCYEYTKKKKMQKQENNERKRKKN